MQRMLGAVLGRVVLFAALFLAPIDSPAFSARSWRTEHGLPHRQIRDLHQSRDGYIWIATPAGLVRFDGHEFFVFTRAAFPELTDEDVFAVAETKDGSLWAGSSGCLARWQNGRLTVFTEVAGVRGLNAAPDGALLAATTNGIARFANGKLERLTTGHGLTGMDIRTVGQDMHGTIWAGPEHWMYEGALNRMPKGGRFEVASQVGLHWMAHSMTLDPAGRFWWGDNVGAHVITPEGRRDFRSLDETSSSVISRLRPARGGVLAVVTPRVEYPGRAGIFLVTPEGAQRLDVGELDQPTVAIEDFEGATWVGTREDGLWQFQRKAVRTWRVENGLADDYVNAVVPAPGGVAAVSELGVVLIGPGRKPAIITPPGHILGYTRTAIRWLGTGEWLAVSPRGEVHSTDSGQWRAETDAAGFFAEVAEAAAQKILKNPTSTFAIEEVPEGLFVCGRGRLAFRAGMNVWKKNVPGAPLGLALVRKGAQPGMLWAADAAGTLHQLAYHVGEDRQPSVHVVRSWTGGSGLAGRIRAIEVSADGIVWLGTDRGLAVLQDQRLSMLTGRNGLPTVSIYSVVEDQRGALWMGSSRGILRAERNELLAATRSGHRVSFVVLREAEGMPTSETMGGLPDVACEDGQGQIWFATAKGLVQIDPTREYKNNAPPKVTIEEALVDDEPTSDGARLAPGRGRTVEFRFTGTSLADPRRNRFRYRLEGVDGGWREVEERRAVYTLLRPGGYEFRVLAVNNHGVPSVTPASFRFSIAPYFWQTASFQLLCGLALALAALAWHRRRIAVWRKIHELERERQLQSERARIARDMHDDLGAGLARVALLSDLAARDHDATATRQLRTISRQLIRSLDEIVWAAHPGKDNTEDVISYLGEFSQEFLAGGPVTLRLELPEAGETIHVPSRVRHSLLMALKEALHNVVKHSGASLVTVKLRVEIGSLRMEVIDNGAGLNGRHRTGHGLENMRERLRAVGGELEISSTPNGVHLSAEAPLNSHEPKTKRL